MENKMKHPFEIDVLHLVALIFVIILAILGYIPWWFIIVNAILSFKGITFKFGG